jgi:phytoene dehydrogenase-like protein
MATEAGKAEAAHHETPTVPQTATAAAPGKIIIIGGGIAGLSCGCYLQMSGFQTEILEAGALPGGLCAAWQRGPYVFDGCLRWLIGTRPPSAFHQIWQELGAIAGREILTHAEILQVEGAHCKPLAVPADLDKLARGFKDIAPEDTALIDQLVRAARRCASLEPPLDNPVELMTAFEKMRMALRYLPMVPVILRWKNRTLPAYLAQYRNDLLRETLMAMAGNERMSALVLVMMLAFRTRQNSGFVAGGSRAFAEAIAGRYVRLGGSLRYKTRVVSVKVEKDRATGVQCADGRVVPASTVVSCADGYTTIFKMLDGRFVDKKILFLYQRCDLFPALIQVSLGINKTFPDAPHSLSLPLVRPLIVDDQTRHSRMEVETFGSNSALCAEGKTIFTVRLPSRCEFWTNLRTNHRQRYRAEKRAIIREVIGVLDNRFPGLAQHLERCDVATPATFVRYTGNWQGSYEGWLPTPRILGRRIPYTLPGLEDFYMAGHWVVAGGGLPLAALCGRYVAQMICARNGKVFAASEP